MAEPRRPVSAQSWLENQARSSTWQGIKRICCSWRLNPEDWLKGHSEVTSCLYLAGEPGQVLIN